MNWIVTGMEFPANQYVTNPTLILTKHPPNYNWDSGSRFQFVSTLGSGAFRKP